MPVIAETTYHVGVDLGQAADYTAVGVIESRL
jgi:hypothetical protein